MLAEARCPLQPTSLKGSWKSTLSAQSGSTVLMSGEGNGASIGCRTTKPFLLELTNACTTRWWSSFSPAPAGTRTARFPVGPRPTRASPSAGPAEAATIPSAAATTAAGRRNRFARRPAIAYDPLGRTSRRVVLGPSRERPRSTETTRSAAADRAASRASASSSSTTIRARPGRTE